jgi:hypothetical protein
MIVDDMMKNIIAVFCDVASYSLVDTCQCAVSVFKVEDLRLEAAVLSETWQMLVCQTVRLHIRSLSICTVSHTCLFIINPCGISVLLATQTLFVHQEKQAMSGAVLGLEPQLQPTTTDRTVGTSDTEVSGILQ